MIHVFTFSQRSHKLAPNWQTGTTLIITQCQLKDSRFNKSSAPRMILLIVPRYYIGSCQQDSRFKIVQNAFMSFHLLSSLYIKYTYSRQKIVLKAHNKKQQSTILISNSTNSYKYCKISKISSLLVFKFTAPNKKQQSTILVTAQILQILKISSLLVFKFTVPIFASVNSLIILFYIARSFTMWYLISFQISSNISGSLLASIYSYMLRPLLVFTF